MTLEFLGVDNRVPGMVAPDLPRARKLAVSEFKGRMAVGGDAEAKPRGG
jgi:hypothetical protein